MATETQLLYLEPDDEITSVVRRLRETDAPRVVLVASGRTKATTSAVALRLLAGVAAEDGREVVLVADAFARSLAGEAGIPAFASVADANADGAVPLEPAAPRRAPIHVVRGEAAPAAAPAPPLAPAAQRQPQALSDETQVVRLPAPAPSPRPPRLGMRRLPRATLGALAALLLAASAALAAILPAATITIRPATVPVGPVSYTVQPAPQAPDEGVVTATLPGTATGVFHELVAATGSVTFLNWNTVNVEVPAGTEVSVAGEQRFTTAERVVVPAGSFTPDGRVQAGEASVGVTATQAGPSGNVAAGAIDTIETASVRAFLRGFPNNRERLVVNPAATSAGADNPLPVIQQVDVDAVTGQITAQLLQGLDERLAEHADRLYPALATPAPVIEVPEGLVGSQGQATFELTGTLTYLYPYVLRADVEAEGTSQLLTDESATPPGTTLLSETIDVEPGAVTSDGQAVSVEVSVRAEAAPEVDLEQLLELVAGKTPQEVVTELEEIGDATVELWPDWVDRVPRLDWRVQIDVAPPDGSPSPQAS